MIELPVSTVNGTMTPAEDPCWPYGPPGTYDVHFDGERFTKIVTGFGKRTKVALVGFSEPSKVGCPYADESYEVWSLNQHARHQPRASRWFEIHTREQYLSDMVPGTDYLKWLQTCPIPIYVTELYPDMPTAMQVPQQEIIDAGACVWEQRRSDGQYAPRDYTQSSLVVMLMVAMLEGFDTIGIYGVDLIVGTEWFHQKPNMEWFIGFCQGRGYSVTRGAPRGVGREVVIPVESALLHQNYSYGPQTAGDNPLRPLMVDRQNAIVNGKGELIDTLQQIDGELGGNFRWIQFLEKLLAGETVSWTHSDGTVEEVTPTPESLLRLLRLRQQHCLAAKEDYHNKYQQAEGELKGVTNWLTVLEMQDRGARPKWRFVDGHEEFIKPPRG